MYRYLSFTTSIVIVASVINHQTPHATSTTHMVTITSVCVCVRVCWSTDTVPCLFLFVLRLIFTRNYRERVCLWPCRPAIPRLTSAVHRFAFAVQMYRVRDARVCVCVCILGVAHHHTVKIMCAVAAALLENANTHAHTHTIVDSRRSADRPRHLSRAKAGAVRSRRARARAGRLIWCAAALRVRVCRMLGANTGGRDWKKKLTVTARGELITPVEPHLIARARACESRVCVSYKRRRRRPHGMRASCVCHPILLRDFALRVLSREFTTQAANPDHGGGGGLAERAISARIQQCVRNVRGPATAS